MEQPIFQALADPVRRKILELLGSHDMSAGDIAAMFPIAAPSVSRHLFILKSAGLIHDKRHGRHIIYSLNNAAVRDVIAWFYNSFGNVWMSQSSR